jgi:RNA polymerase sigma factor (TIGR02999 family)
VATQPSPSGDATSDPGAITEVLGRLAGDRPGAREELFRLVYADLRSMAEGYMLGERRGHTLQPTALVHEAYLRLMGGAEISWQDRREFFRAAARSMRQILVDHARARLTAKRGGGSTPVSLVEARDTPIEHGEGGAEEILAVHEALDRLVSFDSRQGNVVLLRFFGGLSFREAAEVLDISERSAHRAWDCARLWLYREIAS